MRKLSKVIAAIIKKLIFPLCLDKIQIQKYVLITRKLKKKNKEMKQRQSKIKVYRKILKKLQNSKIGQNKDNLYVT